MKTLREKLYEITYKDIQEEDQKPMTSVQKLQAENERRRQQLDLKKENLQDKKTIRAIGGIITSPFLYGISNQNAVGLAGKAGQKGQEYQAKGSQLANKTQYGRYNIW